MKAAYDPESDTLYLQFAEAAVIASEEIRPGVVLDFDASGHLVAIEILDASMHLARGANLRRFARFRGHAGGGVTTEELMRHTRGDEPEA
jgi:uncharacterized protein YuzE